MTQVDDYSKIRLTSQIIKSITIVLQKVLKYLNGAAILTSFVVPIARAFLVTFILDLNEDLLPGKLTVLPLLSLKFCHNIFDVS